MYKILPPFIIIFLACSGLTTKNPTAQNQHNSNNPEDYKGYKIPTTPEGYVLVNEETLYGKKPQVLNPPAIKESIPKDVRDPVSIPRPKTPRVTPQKEITPPLPTALPPNPSPQPIKNPRVTPQMNEESNPDYIPPTEYQADPPADDFIFIPTDIWVNQNVGGQGEEEEW